MKAILISFFLPFFMVVLSSTTFCSPLIKIERDLVIEVDSSTKTISELHVYSYPMANANGFMGTYTELLVYNFQKILLYRNQKTMTIPYLDSQDRHMIRQKRTTYDLKGNILSIVKTVKSSDDFVYKKEKKISFNEDGDKTVENHLSDIKMHTKGYHKPTKVQLLVHRIHNKKA